jgi:hypothetical protein
MDGDASGRALRPRSRHCSPAWRSRHSSPAVALDFCGRATAVGSFERSGFLTDTICPKAPPRARDARRSCLNGDCLSMRQRLVGGSKHLRNQSNPTQDHQANLRERRFERFVFASVLVRLPPLHIFAWSACDHGQGSTGRPLGFPSSEGHGRQKATPPLRRDLGEERFEHPSCFLGPRLDAAAHLADMTGGGAGIG